LIEQAKKINIEGFNLLNIDSQLDFETLKICYRNAAKSCHPDVGGNTLKMQIVNEAYSQFHKLIELNNYVEQGNETKKCLEDIIYYAYVDLISILIDSWDIDNAYNYLKEAIKSLIFSEFPGDKNDHCEYYLCSKVAVRLPSVGLKNEALKLLDLAETFINNTKHSHDLYITKVNKLRMSITNNEKDGSLIQHKIQAENAKRLGLITEDKFNEFIIKIENHEQKDNKQCIESKDLLNNNVFIVPLKNEEKIFKELSIPKRQKLIPETNYFETDINQISHSQQWEYFKVFSDRSDLSLIKKYIFVRLDSYIQSVYGTFSKELCCNVINEIKLIVNLFKGNNSIIYYSNLILKGLNILISLDNNTIKRRLSLIERYIKEDMQRNSTIGLKIKGLIYNGLPEFLSLSTDEIERVLHENKSYVPLKRSGHMDTKKK
jgi:hypothetical protein